MTVMRITIRNTGEVLVFFMSRTLRKRPAADERMIQTVTKKSPIDTNIETDFKILLQKGFAHDKLGMSAEEPGEKQLRLQTWKK